MRERKAGRRARLRAWGRGMCPPRRMPRPRHRRKIRSDGTPRPAADDARCGRSPGLRVIKRFRSSQGGCPSDVSGTDLAAYSCGGSQGMAHMKRASPCSLLSRISGTGSRREYRGALQIVKSAKKRKGSSALTPLSLAQSCASSSQCRRVETGRAVKDISAGHCGFLRTCSAITSSSAPCNVSTRSSWAWPAPERTR